MGIPLFSPAPAGAPGVGVTGGRKPEVTDQVMPVGEAPVPTEPGLEKSPEATAADFGGVPQVDPGDTAGVQTQLAGTDYALPLINSPAQAGPAQTIRQEGSNYLPFGGKEGTENWDYVSKTAPQEIGRAIDEGAKAEAQKSQALADWYKQEKSRQEETNAVLRQRQEERQAEVQAKQAQLEDMATRYSNDLADRGQYWRNPGNIVASIATALMTLGGTSPVEVSKIIANQVNADYAQRRQLADMHLGELRSNVSAFRQMAGDKNLGDQLARADSNRVAAMEIDRIANQFQGPIIKAKAAAMKAQFMRDYQLQMGQLYSKMIYNAPAPINPAVNAEYVKGGKAFPGVGWTPFAPPTTKPGTTASSNATVGGVPGQAVGQYIAPTIGGPGGDGMNDKQLYEFNQRYPGAGDQLQSERYNLVRQAMAEAGASINFYKPGMSDAQIAEIVAKTGKNPDPRKNVQAFNESVIKLRKELSEDQAKIAAQAQPLASRISLYRRASTDMSIIQRAAESKGMTPDVFVNTTTGKFLGPGNVRAWNDLMASYAPGNKHQAEVDNLRRAVLDYHQIRMMGINEYIHKNAGGAVSKSEDERMRQVADPNMSFESAKNFFGQISNDAQTEYRMAVTGKHPISSTLYNLKQGSGPGQLAAPGIVSTKEAALENLQVGNTGKRPMSEVPQKGSAEDPEVIRAIANLKAMSGGK